MSTSTVEILKRARGYIERGWTQGMYAYTADGIACHPTSARAVRWCTYGAIDAARDHQPGAEAVAAILDSIPRVGGISNWNDDPSRTQLEVLQAFTRAIELAEKRESAE